MKNHSRICLLQLILIFFPTKIVVIYFQISSTENNNLWLWKHLKEKALGKWFGHFWFLNHSLRWFLMVSPKDEFAPD
jgi:hypothetical protein